MPIRLNPQPKPVRILMYYVEEIKEPWDIPIYKFLTTKEEFDKQKEKGFITEQQLLDLQKEQQMKKQAGEETVDIDTSKVIYTFDTTWARPTWAEHNRIYTASLRTTPGPEGRPSVNIDMLALRDHKIKSLLKGWNLTDDSGQPVKVSAKAIDSLPPDVVEHLIDAFEKATEPTEEELKN